MRVDYKTILKGDRAQEEVSWGGFSRIRPKPEDVHEIAKVALAFCCDDMKEAWDEAVGFGDRESRVDGAVNFWVRRYHDCWDAIAIRFCPWCAEAIECVEVQRTRLVATGVRVRKKQEIEYTEVDATLPAV